MRTSGWMVLGVKLANVRRQWCLIITSGSVDGSITIPDVKVVCIGLKCTCWMEIKVYKLPCPSPSKRQHVKPGITFISQ